MNCISQENKSNEWMMKYYFKIRKNIRNTRVQDKININNNVIICLHYSNNVMLKSIIAKHYYIVFQALERIIGYGNVHVDISDERKEM